MNVKHKVNFMTVHGYKPPQENTMRVVVGKPRYRRGPNGEKRPVSDVSNAVRIMEIATGIREEEYYDDVPKHKRKRCKKAKRMIIQT